MDKSLPTYGGQAVIEGVMMRGARAVAIAMRAPDNQIVVHTEKLGGIYKSKLIKLPFLRGLVVLWDALGLGMRALTISANLQTGEEEKLEGAALYLTIGISLVIGVGLFFLLPAGVAHYAEELVVNIFNPPLAQTSSWTTWSGNLFEGATRLLIMLAYISLVGQMEDIKRVFAYHGAEHKTINAFEAGAELRPEIVANFSLEHPRCGTAFLLTLVLASILIFTLLGPLPLIWRLVSRILLIPFLAALAYEYIRWTATNLHHPLVQWLIRPNLALQRLTTREPTLDMLEVAITSFNTMQTEEEMIVS